MAEVAAWVVHRAGPISRAGLQSCSRCGAVLVDYAGARPKPFGWPARSQVARFDGVVGAACVQFVGPLQPDMRPCTEVA